MSQPWGQGENCSGEILPGLSQQPKKGGRDGEVGPDLPALRVQAAVWAAAAPWDV